MSALVRKALLSLACLALVAPAAVAEASPSTAVAQSKANYTLHVFSQNIEGAVDPHGTRLSNVMKRIGSFKPDVIMLEEICYSQVQRLHRLHPKWTMHYSRMLDKGGCRSATNTNHPKSIGELIASPHRMTAIRHYALPGYLNVKREEHTRKRNFHLTCADISLPRIRTNAVRACVTHTRSGYETGEAYRDTERLRQTKAIAKFTAPWITSGQLVVLAGDFNARPLNASLNPIYRLSHSGAFTGPGRFVESDQTDHTFFPAGCTSHCRSGASTIGTAKTSTARRFDYIFYSKGADYDLHGEALPADGSDHLPIRSRATVPLART